MRFGTRNLYYLRISATAVLPLYLYLDEQHVDWMSERVLQHVLSDLRPLIPDKLLVEADAHLGPGGPANARRGTVDVHRGDTYQFGYFLRNTDPHAIVIKTRRFTAAPREMRKVEPSDVSTKAEDVPTGRTKQKRTGTSKQASKGPASTSRATKGKRKQRVQSGSSEDEAQETDDEATQVNTENYDTLPPPVAPRRSLRKRTVLSRGYREDDALEGVIVGSTLDSQDESMQVDARAMEADYATSDMPAPLSDEGLIAMDESEDISQLMVKAEPTEPILTNAPPPTRDVEPIIVDEDLPTLPDATPPGSPDPLHTEEEEDKPKPVMSLTYQGFRMHGRCLCVIVEPYPPIRQRRAMSLQPTGLAGPRAPSIAPAHFVPSGGATQRARTPLFLPDPDERDRSTTPAPVQRRVLPPVPLWNDESADTEEGESDDGMLAFSQALQSVGGYGAAGENDDEMDGSVFLGDADEAKGL